ncbi:hypothetical protein WICMUC_001298 [Wickerhamomyces mucosus]|uniref:Chloride channel protein n=1 Tax=Wickerhamomyces mucosus TaxID=1378264 RepID=A0A9P8PX58_9ASCO|nr:hypothetical protein WICMUC_001298 [Wickerhamomyces mucosus]
MNSSRSWDEVPIINPTPVLEKQELDDFSYTKHYKNMTSIDWIHEYQRDKQFKEVNYTSTISRLISQSSKWIILVSTGLSIGLVTSCLDYLYRLLSDLKRGVCSTGILYTHAACCPSYSDSDVCETWKQWDQVIGIDSNTAGSFVYKYFLYIITSLVLATIAALLTKNQKFIRTSGISETKTMISGVIINDFLSTKTLVIKLLGLLLIVSSGFWAGKEGPLVHISLALCELLIKQFPLLNANEAKKREFLLAATAAGISVAFNAPISGVIFTLEQITSYFNPSDKMWMSFVCAMSGVVMLNFFKEGLEIYVKMDNQWLGLELFGFILLGVLGGAYGAIFNRLNLFFANFRRKYISSKGSNYEIIEIIILSIVTSFITYPLILPRLPLTSLITRLFKECGEDTTGSILCEVNNSSGIIFLLASTLIAGLFLTAYTFGTIVPAGVLMPSLVLGAISGRIIGIIFEKIQNSNDFLSNICLNSNEMCISPAAYAVVGSAAFLAGITKMTVWCVVTVFELTGALTYVLPIMITVIVARWVNDAFDELNCYDYWIEFFNYPYLHEINRPLPLIEIKKIFSENLKINNMKVFYEDDDISVKDLVDSIANCVEFQGVPILENRTSKFVKGWVSLLDLEKELDIIQLKDDINSSTLISFFKSQNDQPARLNLSHLVERYYTILNGDTLLPTVADIFFKLKSRFVIICDEGEFRGLITLKDISEVVKMDRSLLHEIADRYEENVTRDTGYHSDSSFSL